MLPKISQYFKSEDFIDEELNEKFDGCEEIDANKSSGIEEPTTRYEKNVKVI